MYLYYQNCFPQSVDFGPVNIYSSGSGTAGKEFSLTCSATLTVKRDSQQSSDIPSMPFEWSFGPNNASLPSGVTPVAINNGDTYTSTLQFSPLRQSHAGIYTCRVGAGRLLMNSTMVTVNGPGISLTNLNYCIELYIFPAPAINIHIVIPTGGAPMLGHNALILSCGVHGLPKYVNSSITYAWTKNNGTQTQIQVGTDPSLQTLSFYPLKLSDAGQYTCQATVISPYLDLNNITVMESHNITCPSESISCYG